MAIYSIPTTIELKNVSQETIDVKRKDFKEELKERNELIQSLVKKYSYLHPPKHRVIMAVDLWYKNRVALGDSGVVLERPREYDEFNRRLTQPIQGVIINGKNLPSGAEILVHHNSFDETNKLFKGFKLSPVT